MVQFADILLPFIMSLLLVTILDPVKQETYVVLECVAVLFFQNVSFLGCCLRPSRRPLNAGERQAKSTSLREWVEKLLLIVSIAITVLLAGRLFWIVGRIVWLSGEAIIVDFEYYKEGVEKRGEQAQALLKKYHLDKQASLDTEDLSSMALEMLRYVADFFTQHVFYSITQVSLTTIFVLFLLYSPVQRDFAPVMQGVFSSMELYLKLKTFISLSGVLWAFLAQFILHFNIANFVEPIVFGTTEEIHSVVVLLGLSFFGYIWGFRGMFLSVPLLFAIHAWLDIVASTPSYPAEARDDARFIMGILEGKWLADSPWDNEEEAGATSPSPSAEHIELVEPELLPHGAQPGGPPPPVPGGGGPAGLGEGGRCAPLRGFCSAVAGSEAPISQWEVTSWLRRGWEVRDPATDEVLMPGLLFRCAVLGGAYVMVFFGFSIFNWDLGSVIHPSGTSGDAVPLNTSGQAMTTVARRVSTTIAATSWTIPTTAAAFTAPMATVAATQTTTSARPNDDGGSAGPEANSSHEHRHHADSARPKPSRRPEEKEEEEDPGDTRPTVPAPGGHRSSVDYVDDLGGPNESLRGSQGVEPKRRHNRSSGQALSVAGDLET
ncbi:unnamed protein product [Prorocentrum cordatum]|uniref:Uncharacterized protein n=1 Tax=Prorocentrum cordatum TaxID=2364126 RepID=A0ABN9S7Y9_9DINO|nr:unnamed protein product [Polarella glacialis]